MTAKVLRGSFGAIQEQSIKTKTPQDPGKRSLPGRPTKARRLRRQDPGKRSLPRRPPKASQGTCRGAPRVPARPGERQASGRDKTTAAARRLPWQATTLYPRFSTSTNVSLWGPFQVRVAGGCAASGARWHAKLTRLPSWRAVAPLTVLFLHCLGDTDGHLMPLSPAVRVR